MNTMKGTLHKWTNYISGWQPRWFVLESGVLSYYVSPEEVTQGSRRSYKAASCHVNVDKHDELNLQVVTPDKDTLYLRAGDKTEKQRWVVALASAKLEDHQVDAPDRQEAVPQGPPTKSKSTQLRETCNHLLTQVQGIKMAATQSPPDVESLQAMGSTLSIRCDDFLRLTQEVSELSHTHSAPVTPVGVGGTSHVIGLSSRVKRSSTSDDEARLQRPRHKQHNPTSSLPTHLTVSQNKSDKEKIKAPTTIEQSKENIEIPAHASSEVFITPANSPHHSPPPSPTPHAHTPTQPQLNTIRSRAIANQNQRPMCVGVEQQDVSQDRKYDTFFSLPKCQFGDIVLEEGDEIPTKIFLECAEELLPFFDALSPTAFAPVKADLGGNIHKTLRKYEEDPDRYSTLQGMMTHEIETDTAGSNSATESLLWLKRSMEFIYLFLAELARGETLIDTAAGKAYSKSLSRHHNWIVRGIFSLAIKAMPYHADLMVILGSDGSDESLKQVIQDIGVYAQNIGEICVILDEFLVHRNVETES